MIGFLIGRVDLLDRPYIYLNVNNVGYKILVSESIFSKLKIGEDLKIYTYTYVKEDALDLFGFLDSGDLKLFQLLISVSGIGPKTALNIFSFGERKEIIYAISSGDVGFFTSVPRLGTKNAQRIIVDLKTKLGSTAEIDLTGKDSLENAEIVQALKNFGFTTDESRKALKSIKAEGLSIDEKIKLSLKALGRR